MTKNPKRVAAGKRAWNKLSASVKSARLAGLRRGRKSKGSTSQSRGQNMAKGNGNNKKQGIVSWLTSAIALAIGFSNVGVRVAEALAPANTGQRWKIFCLNAMKDYAGLTFDWNWKYVGFRPMDMARGYAPIAAGIAFKKGTSYLVKTAKMKSLIPRLGL